MRLQFRQITAFADEAKAFLADKFHGIAALIQGQTMRMERAVDRFEALTIKQTERLEVFMSELSDEIAKLTGKMDDAEKRDQEHNAALADQIAGLQQQIEDLKNASGGAATPEDLAAIKALEDRLDALDPATP